MTCICDAIDALLSIGTGLFRNATDATVVGEKEMADERVNTYSGSTAINLRISWAILNRTLPALSLWPFAVASPT